MASKRGMTIRNQAAEARIDAAIATLVARADVPMPTAPARTRDPLLNATLRLEWIAAVLERLAASGEDTTDLEAMSVAQLRELAKQSGITLANGQRKADLVAAIRQGAAGESEDA